MSKIAVIGTGNMGKGIAQSLAKAGHTVLLGSRSKQNAAEVAAELGQSLVHGVSNQEAADQAGIVFLAIPFQPNNELISELRDTLQGKIVVDISNPLNASYDGVTTEPGTSAAETIASQLPGSQVVTAFKNTFAGVFHEPQFGSQRTTVFVTGNSEEAKAQVVEILSELPFEVLDAGDLSVSRTLEQMTVLLIGLSMKHNYNWRAGFQLLA